MLMLIEYIERINLNLTLELSYSIYQSNIFKYASMFNNVVFVNVWLCYSDS